MAELNIDS
jgi:G3E family GTPase